MKPQVHSCIAVKYRQNNQTIDELSRLALHNKNADFKFRQTLHRQNLKLKLVAFEHLSHFYSAACGHCRACLALQTSLVVLSVVVPPAALS